VTEESVVVSRGEDRHTHRGALLFLLLCVLSRGGAVSLPHTVHTVYAHTITKPVDAYCTIEYENIFEFTNDLITLA
jgi:hypothetical protein